MATGILFALTVVLVAAACYVGLLLVRRPRPAAQAERPRTVGDLVRGRSAAPEDLAGGDDLSGTDLFTPKAPGAKAAAPSAPDDAPSPTGGSSAAEVAVPRPTPRPAATPPGGVEVGDAPWRRAARMMGSEPGGAWETAPMPVVAAAQPVREVPKPTREVAQAGDRSEGGRTAVLDAPAPAGSTAREVGRAAVAVVAVPEPVDAPTADRSPTGEAADSVTVPAPAAVDAAPAPVDVDAPDAREVPGGSGVASPSPAVPTPTEEAPEQAAPTDPIASG